MLSSSRASKYSKEDVETFITNLCNELKAVQAQTTTLSFLKKSEVKDAFSEAQKADVALINLELDEIKKRLSDQSPASVICDIQAAVLNFYIPIYIKYKEQGDRQGEKFLGEIEKAIGKASGIGAKDRRDVLALAEQKEVLKKGQLDSMILSLAGDPELKRIGIAQTVPIEKVFNLTMSAVQTGLADEKNENAKRTFVNCMKALKRMGNVVNFHWTACLARLAPVGLLAGRVSEEQKSDIDGMLKLVDPAGSAWTARSCNDLLNLLQVPKDGAGVKDFKITIEQIIKGKCDPLIKLVNLYQGEPDQARRLRYSYTDDVRAHKDRLSNGVLMGKSSEDDKVAKGIKAYQALIEAAHPRSIHRSTLS